MKIVLESLTKIFPARGKKGAGEVIAVNDFCLEIPDGALVGLLGPSGCGKSTALNLISGLLEPNGGRIFFGEDEVTRLAAEKRGVGLVFQNYALYPHLTVLQNILFPLENIPRDERPIKQEMLERARAVSELVQIEQLFERRPSELSGGQQQRVAIARALVKMPRVLLLDEPLSNLDARLRLQTRQELRRIQRETKISTIFVTHDQEEAMSICDLIVVMREGFIEQLGKPQEVYDEPDTLFVAKFLGSPPINVFNAAVKNERLFIGEDEILPMKGIEDKEVFAAIRPEGFVLNDEGALGCEFERLELMGADMSIVSKNKACTEATLRSVIAAEQAEDFSPARLRFDIKPSKIFVFDKKTQGRIRPRGEC